MERKSKQKVEEDRVGFRGDPEPEGAPAAFAGNKDWGDDWVHELIEMTRPGVEIEFPAREIDEREVPFVYDDFR